MRKILALAFAGSLALMGISVGSAFADTVLRYGPWLPPGYVLNEAVFFPWAKKVEEVTEGRVKIDILPSAVGSAAAQVDIVADGASDMAVFIAGYTPGRFDLLQLGEMPNLSADVAKLAPAFYRAYQNHLADKNLFGNDHLISIFATTPTFIVTDTAIDSIDDLAGLKLRAPTALSIETIKALGAVPTQQPVSEMYELISSGIVDGSLLAFQPVLGWNLQGLLTNVTITPGGVGQAVMGVLVNGSKWASISEEDRAAITAISGEQMAIEAGKAYAAAEQESRDTLIEAGVKIAEADEALQAAVIERLSPQENAWIELAKARGLDDPAAVLKALRDDLAKN